MDPRTLTVHDITEGLSDGSFSSREVAAAYLAEAKRAMDDTKAYVQLDEEFTLAQADAADRRRAEEVPLSPLDGVPIAVKDNILVAGLKATAGSNIIKDYVAPYDATVVRRLKDAGMVVLGKTNMDEFAMGSSTETSCHGPTRNPWDRDRIPGGSSGGSAAAVAEGTAPLALGSDTGGSVRQPSAMCGVVGLKPTYGRVSRYGLMAMASSLDQIGPLARSSRDAAALLRTIEGRDPKDSTSVELKADWSVPDDPGTSLEGKRIGMPKEYFVSGMDEGVERAVRDAAAKLEELGAEVREVSLPNAGYALAVYYVLMPSEASTNLSRFDGMRYGTRVRGSDLEATYRRSRGQGFGDEVTRRIMMGTHALSSGYYDAYYLRALKVRRLIANDFANAFQDVDCILAPTTPSTAWKIGERIDDPLSMYLGDVFTVSANVAGLPAISVPCGLSNGLPVGLQLIGDHYDERTILGIAHAYETVRGEFPRPGTAS